MKSIRFPRRKIVVASTVASLLVLWLSACSSSRGQPTVTRTADGSAASHASDSSTQPSGGAYASATASASDVADTSPAAQAPTALIALLPTQITGKPVRRVSMTGAAFVVDSMIEKGPRDFAAGLGAPLQELSVAFCVLSSSEAGIYVFRVEGASGADLIRRYQAAGGPETRGGGGPALGTIGGKPTVTIADPGHPMYLYASGDVVFFVSAGNESGAAEILSSLR